MKGATPEREAADGFILGIETATPEGGLALASTEGELIAHVWHASAQPISKRLLDELDRILEVSAVKPVQIKAIATSLGPGAFTGLRVGLTHAKTLARSWGVRLYGYSTLEGMARRWAGDGEIVCPLLDARRSEVYAGLYRTRAGEAPEMLREDCVEPIEATLDELQALGDMATVRFAGSGAIKYRSTIENSLGSCAEWFPPSLTHPAADVLALAGAAAWRAGEPGLEPLEVAPRYLRRSDAEVRHGIDAGLLESPITPPR